MAKQQEQYLIHNSKVTWKRVPSVWQTLDNGRKTFNLFSECQIPSVNCGRDLKIQLKNLKIIKQSFTALCLLDGFFSSVVLPNIKRAIKWNVGYTRVVVPWKKVTHWATEVLSSKYTQGYKDVWSPTTEIQITSSISLINFRAESTVNPFQRPSHAKSRNLKKGSNYRKINKLSASCNKLINK